MWPHFQVIISPATKESYITAMGRGYFFLSIILHAVVPLLEEEGK